MVSTPSGYLFRRAVIRCAIYALLILVACSMLVPFVWMLSSSLKLNKDVFAFPMRWIPDAPRWQNYADIWVKIPLGKFAFNTLNFRLSLPFCSF
jgi:multiple sugar transport system permease protein